MEITSKRDFIGMIFFALSVILLGYMFVTPSQQLHNAR